MNNESNPVNRELVNILSMLETGYDNKHHVAIVIEHIKERIQATSAPLTKAVSITDSEIDAMFPRNYISNGINPGHWEPIGDARNMAAKHIRDLMFKRNVISIQRDNLIEEFKIGE